MSLPTLTYADNIFRLRCSFDEREIPRNAGFRFDPEMHSWYTYDLAVAVALREYADQSAKIQLSKHCLQISPWPDALPPTPKGLTLMPHQVEAVMFALGRNRSYLGLDAGLGKTPVAAMVARATKKRVVYICPPFLLYNVMAEFKRWGAEHLIYIFPDSLIVRPDTQALIRDFVVGGYSDTIVVDEAHRYKSSEAKRTQALFGKGRLDGIVQQFSRQIFMSGTPMPNRPIELFPVLSKAASETIDHFDYFKYGMRYCGGKRTDYGWDFSGATNMQELRERVIHPSGPFMLRQKKALLNLPPKIEEIFVVSADMSPKLTALEAKIGERYGDVEDVIKHQLAKSAGKEGDDLHIASYRRLLGVEKVKVTSDYVHSILDETSDAVLLFAYHKEVVAGLTLKLKRHGPIVIDGSVKPDDRQKLVTEFQKCPARRLVIANYIAAGIGFTLTKATRVIFAEFDYVPGVNSQASDRTHRIGQDKTVLVQYVLFKDSLDKKVLEILLRKNRILKYI